MNVIFDNEEFRNEITKMAGESFDEGVKACMESTLEGLRKLHEKQPNLTFEEVIAVLVIWKDVKQNEKITNS